MPFYAKRRLANANLLNDSFSLFLSALELIDEIHVHLYIIKFNLRSTIAALARIDTIFFGDIVMGNSQSYVTLGACNLHFGIVNDSHTEVLLFNACICDQRLQSHLRSSYRCWWKPYYDIFCIHSSNDRQTLLLQHLSSWLQIPCHNYCT